MAKQGALAREVADLARRVAALEETVAGFDRPVHVQVAKKTPAAPAPKK